MFVIPFLEGKTLVKYSQVSIEKFIEDHISIVVSKNIVPRFIA